MSEYQRPTPPPPGTAGCRTYKDRRQFQHLVLRNERGTPGPTLCGLTRFDERDPETLTVIRVADLPGWSINGGTTGRDVEQVDCAGCFDAYTSGSNA